MKVHRSSDLGVLKDTAIKKISNANIQIMGNNMHSLSHDELSSEVFKVRISNMMVETLIRQVRWFYVHFF
jgi:hypothetical protein